MRKGMWSRSRFQKSSIGPFMTMGRLLLVAECCHECDAGRHCQMSGLGRICHLYSHSLGCDRTPTEG